MSNRLLSRWLTAAACCLSLCCSATADDYATPAGLLKQPLVVRDTGGFAGAGTGTRWVIEPAGDWRHSELKTGRRVETAGKLSQTQMALLVDQLVRYDLKGLPREINSMTIADGINVLVEFGEQRATFYAKAGLRELPSPETSTPAGRLAGIVVAVRQAIEAADAAGDDTAKVVAGNTEFALELYRYLAREPGDIFLSPASISIALGMTYAGARGETAQEMAATLHFMSSSETLHAAMGKLLVSPPGEKPDYQLHAANSLWRQTGYEFSPEFLTLVERHYAAGVREADFAGQTEAARKAINEWVEIQTRGKITELLTRGLITEVTRMVLTNAVYFKGSWERKFAEAETRERPFYLSKSQSVSAPTMTQKGEFRFYRDSQCRMLELPYAGGHLSFVALLPEKVDGLAELEKALTSASLNDKLSKLKAREVEVFLPRFKLTRRFLLEKALADLGMPQAFDPAKADFTGMRSKPPRNLYIAHVVHKAFIDVNEEGTEAAAATAVVVSERMIRTEEFRADRPFLFFIRDLRNGTILFLGRLANPKAAEGSK